MWRFHVCRAVVCRRFFTWIRCDFVEMQYCQDSEWPTCFTCCMAAFVFSPLCSRMTLSNSLLLFQDGTSLCSLEPCFSYLGKALFATFGEIPQRNTYARERSAERKSSGWIYVVHNGRKQQFYLWPVVIKCRISAENNYSCWLCIVR